MMRGKYVESLEKCDVKGCCASIFTTVYTEPLPSQVITFLGKMLYNVNAGIMVNVCALLPLSLARCHQGTCHALVAMALPY